MFSKEKTLDNSKSRHIVLEIASVRLKAAQSLDLTISYPKSWLKKREEHSSPPSFDGDVGKLGGLDGKAVGFLVPDWPKKGMKWQQVTHA